MLLFPNRNAKTSPFGDVLVCDHGVKGSIKEACSMLSVTSAHPHLQCENEDIVNENRASSS